MAELAEINEEKTPFFVVVVIAVVVQQHSHKLILYLVTKLPP
jgi:hypothetical protein